MKEMPKQIVDELLLAMDTYEMLATELISKLVNETDQPNRVKIESGHFYELQNAELLNGKEFLSDNWRFDVHGEHCEFKNMITDQTLEVALGNESDIGNLDPFFFYQFLDTTENIHHLSKYLGHPFHGTYSIFKYLEQHGMLIRISPTGFRKV